MILIQLRYLCFHKRIFDPYHRTLYFLALSPRATYLTFLIVLFFLRFCYLNTRLFCPFAFLISYHTMLCSLMELKYHLYLKAFPSRLLQDSSGCLLLVRLWMAQRDTRLQLSSLLSYLVSWHMMELQVLVKIRDKPSL